MYDRVFFCNHVYVFNKIMLFEWMEVEWMAMPMKSKKATQKICIFVLLASTIIDISVTVQQECLMSLDVFGIGGP